MMDDDNAIQLLQNAIDKIPKLLTSHLGFSEHIEWIIDTSYLLEDIFGNNSQIYLLFAGLSWQPSGIIPARIYDIERALEYKKQEAYMEQLQKATGILSSGIQLIKRKGVKNVYEGKDTKPEASEIMKIQYLIINKLRKTLRDEPKDEKEVQDRLADIFTGADLDGHFTREKERFGFSVKSYIPDFIFEKIDTAVEVKLCKTEQDVKNAVSQINDDIAAYKTKYSNVIFVVYDLGKIRDQDEFKTGLQVSEQVIVLIVKH